MKVGYTSTRVLGKAYAGSNTILLRRISPHTIAHELMHLAQHNKKNMIPIGERSCDVYTCALGEDVCDTVTYLRIHGATPNIIHTVCKEAITKRNQGFRNYISWVENQFEIRMKSKNE